MADIGKITVTYGCKRSANFQSVDVSATAEVTLGPGESMEDGFAQAMKRLGPLVDKEADAAIRDVVRLHHLG